MQTPTPRGENPPWRYRILLRLLSPILLGYTLWKTAKGGGFRYLKERLGFYNAKPTATHTSQNSLWVHAASVGEVITVLPLVKSWLRSVEDGHVLLTTGTPTGHQILLKQAIAGITHQYLPIDFSNACNRFLSQANISQAWIVETEIWPWLYSQCKRRNINLTIINGRLSNKTSKQTTGILASSYQGALQNIRVLARTSEDAKRFIALGASADNVTIAGDLKYATGNLTSDAKPFISQPYVLAASTHADEELRIAEAWRELNKGSTLLVIAPRHPERGIVVYQELIKKGFSVALRSADEIPQTACDIFIVDTLGELPILYQYAMGTFVGGSLIERGGHNLIEPAQFACPTVVGPHTFNFSDIVARLHKNSALHICHTAAEVASFLVAASNDSPELKNMGKRAQASIEADRLTTLETYQNLLF